MKKVAVIGLGSISVVHINAILKNDFGKIEAICDVKPERIEKAEAAIPYPVRTYTDYKKLLEEVKPDVVHVCTPHYLHKPMAVDAMRNGADVYLEKPAALSYEEGLEILKAEKETGRKVCVSFQNRVIATNLKVKEIIESGEMGAFLGARGIVTWKRTGAYYTESGWRGAWATEGGGVLMNQSIHTLDMLSYFGGDIVKAVGTASLRKNADIIEVEDTAEATLYHESGKTSVFYATNCNAVDSSVMIEVFLEKGKLLTQGKRLYRDIGEGYEVILNDKTAPAVGKAVWGTGHAMMIQRFYAAIDGEDTYYCTLEEGLKVLRVIGDIYKTNPHGKKLK